jgi:Icc protein
MATILQLSDLHLLSRADATLKAVPTYDSLRLVLQRARCEIAEPARVVLSGDLSHEHTAAGYELIQELLGDWAERSLLIPGNHDDRLQLRTVFDQTPGKANDDVWFHDELDDWQLIGLDSHVPGRVDGELSDTMLDQLERWLSEDVDRPTLIFLHHPPASVNSPWLDAIGLCNPERFASLVQRHPSVQGVFCGHIHQVFQGSFFGAVLYSAPSTAFQFLPQTDEMGFDHLPPGFRVIETHQSTFHTRVARLDEMPFSPRDE